MKSPPFSVIGPYYDVLMSDIDYEEWVEYIARLCPGYGKRKLRILDMAGGTGVCAALYHKDGHDVALLDSSPQMLEVARQRFLGEKIDILIHEEDMRHFHLEPRFDLVTCLFDSINNLIHEEDLESCFRSVAEDLEDSGLFVFDMNTEYGLSTFWGDRTLMREDGHVVSVWSNKWDAEKRIATLNLMLFVEENGLYRRLEEVHMEKGYAAKTVTSMLQRVGFSDVSMFKHLTTERPTRFTGRIMFRARK
jgi:SAM-dependent methyltransferase